MLTEGQTLLLQNILDDSRIEIEPYEGTYHGRNGESSDYALVVDADWPQIASAILEWFLEDLQGAERLVDGLSDEHVFGPWSIRWDNLGHSLILY